MNSFSYLKLSELKATSTTWKLFHSMLKVRKDRLRRKYLRSKKFLKDQIIVKLDYYDLKKMESVSKSFRKWANSPIIKGQVFRSKVNNATLSGLYDADQLEIEETGESEEEDNEIPHPISVALHPLFQDPFSKLTYHQERNIQNSISDSIRVSSLSKDPRSKSKLDKRVDVLLEKHTVGQENATNPAVSYFRFDFEDDGKIHRGTLDRDRSDAESEISKKQAGSAKFKVVTIHDVMKWLVKEKGDWLIGTILSMLRCPNQQSKPRKTFYLLDQEWEED